MGLQTTRWIAEASAQLEPADAILLYLSLVLEGQETPELLALLPAESVSAFEPFLQNFLSLPQPDLRFPLLDEIQKLSRQQISHGLEEMDGSWILHQLRQEKPAVIGLILKRLSSERAYQILNSMNPELKAKLPDSEELEQVPMDVVQVVRKCFEDQMVHLPIAPASKVLDFSVLFNLTSKDLHMLVQDLGLELLAIAFQSIHERSLIELVKNLDHEEAERLFDKFKRHSHASRGDVKNAQLEILTLSLDFKDGEDMVLEAGIQRLGRALADSDEDLVVLVQHRLPVRQGYRLRRYYDDFQHGNRAQGMAQKYQNLLVQRLFALSSAGDIDRAWAKMPRGMSISVPATTSRPAAA